MNLEQELADTFERNNWKWNTKAKGPVVPTEEDIQAALDEAARVLYNEPVGSTLEVGRLIIHKKHRGHDVYVYAGSYD